MYWEVTFIMSRVVVEVDELVVEEVEEDSVEEGSAEGGSVEDGSSESAVVFSVTD
jgi:hypothetical protein